jgi:peptide/nickel transport system substrate-binding protein
MTYGTSRWSLVVVGAAAISLACATAGGARTDVAAKPVLTIGAVGTAFGTTNLDPARDRLFYPSVRTLTNEPIVYRRPDGSFSPGLATSWHYIKAKAGSGRANKDFEFTLRKGARFSDGTPVTAQAVKAWLEYFAGANGPAFAVLGPIASVEAVGRRTVRIHLKSPNPNIPDALSRSNWAHVSSPAAVAKPSLLSTRTYGAGPYMLDPAQTVANDHYTLVPNPHYYDKAKQHWSQVVIKVVPAVTSVLQAMQAGQIDVAPGDPSTAATARSAGFTVVRAPGANSSFALDVAGIKLKALADVRVRQAMNYAIRRPRIAAAFVGTNGSPTSALATEDGSYKAYANHYPYNPAKAKSLLAAAGYANGFTIDNVVTAGFVGSLGTPLAQAVAQDLKAVGITLNLRPTTTAAEVVQLALGPDPPAMFQAPFGYFSMWSLYGLAMKPGGNSNHVGGRGWSDARINSLWVKGSRAANATTVWKQITERATKQAYFLPILTSDALWYVNARKVKGVAVGKVYPVLTPNTWTPR